MTPGPAGHAGRRAPVSRSAARRSGPGTTAGGRAAEIGARRAERRTVLVAGAVRTLLREGPASHEAVAARTGLPLGQLRWLYPTSDDLRSVLNPTTPTDREAHP